MSDINSFTSAQIKLAAIIRNKSRYCKVNFKEKLPTTNTTTKMERQEEDPLTSVKKIIINKSSKRHCLCLKAKKKQLNYLPIIILNIIIITITSLNNIVAVQPKTHFTNHQTIVSSKRTSSPELLLRHQTHYLNIIPSSHFQYNEGRQLTAPEGSSELMMIQERSSASSSNSNGGDNDQTLIKSYQQPQDHSHIYKRSSALISSSTGQLHSYTPLVSHSQLHNYNSHPSLIRRRMMSEGAHVRWTSPQMYQQQQAPPENTHDDNNNNNEANEEVLISSASNSLPSSPSLSIKANANTNHEAELLRQKQHIQYHDQWPSMAGKCHKRTLNFCASVLPFNTTTFPNIIGDTNRFEVKRSLPFFGFLAKSSCNKRLDELLCLLLEPPCSIQSGLAIPPCKKFCRLALEGCNEYIPATLAMSSVFDCRQYPDSNDPNVCINLAQGNTCANDEFKCPDKTCIPRKFHYFSLFENCFTLFFNL